MSAFKITGVVITPGNYKKYSKPELPTDGTYLVLPATFNPTDFRPPLSWYKELGFTPDRSHPEIKKWHPDKKPGRKAGTAIRTQRLEIRVDQEFITTLRHLQRSEPYKGKSKADIIDELVKNNAAYLEMAGQLNKGRLIDLL